MHAWKLFLARRPPRASAAAASSLIFWNAMVPLPLLLLCLVFFFACLGCHCCCWWCLPSLRCRGLQGMPQQQQPPPAAAVGASSWGFQRRRRFFFLYLQRRGKLWVCGGGCRQRIPRLTYRTEEHVVPHVRTELVVWIELRRRRCRPQISNAKTGNHDEW